MIVDLIRFFQASNPGQFDSDVDVMWQKGHTGESVYHIGRVGVNTDHPEESLTVHGNMRLTGHLLQPSDMRAKENIQEVSRRRCWILYDNDPVSVMYNCLLVPVCSLILYNNDRVCVMYNC